MDENNNRTQNVGEPTEKQKAQEAGKDVAELVSKGVANHFGGPVGGKIVNKVAQTKAGQRIFNGAGKKLAVNPLTRHILSKSQPLISSAKPVANAAIDSIGSAAGGDASSAKDATGGTNGGATPSGGKSGSGGIPLPKNPLGSGPNGNNNNKNNNKEKSNIRFNDAVKALWKKLPMSVKLYIIGGIGCGALFIILISCILALNPFNFLNYSDDVSESEDVEKSYADFWDDLCNESDSSCTDEEIAAAKKLKEDQTAFYERLDKLSDKYLSKDEKLRKEQRYIVLTTVFFGYEIDDMVNSQGEDPAFVLDESGNDDIDENNNDNNNSSIYKEEKDTLKELVKQFKAKAAICYYKDGVDENGETVWKHFTLKDDNDQPFLFNFFDKFRLKAGLYNDSEYQAAEKSQCKDPHAGDVKVEVEDVNNSEASIDAFYKYLRESEYLDKKKHLKSYYSEYAKSNDLSTDISTWDEEDKIKVREEIIDSIKSIVEEAMVEEEEDLNFFAFGMVGADTDYWWPIGSVETTSFGGITFASGDPQYTYITQKYGSTEMGSPHGGMDLQAESSTNVIASRGGTVVEVVTQYTGGGLVGYNGVASWGNYVLIEDNDGRKERYAHLSYGTITVKAGDTVKQGQVLAKAGATGNVTGPHLHFEIYENGTRIDPLNYVDPNNPRPGKISLTFDNYWWPIGSDKVTTKNGKKFADGDPGILGITQKYGNAGHIGLDIEGYKSSPYKIGNVIASKGGKVIEINKNCPSYTPDASCGGTYGNFVLIQDDSGRKQRYAHLEKESMTVKVGDTVEQGEFIARAGNSGNSSAIHLHFEMYEANGNLVDPEKYVSMDDPRPEGFGLGGMSGEFATLVRWIDEFEGGNKSPEGNYYITSSKLDGVHTSGHGITLKYNRGAFAKYGINVDDYMYDGSKLPVALVDQVRVDVVLGMLEEVQTKVSNAGIALNEYQLYALTSFSFNLGSGYIPNFIRAYKQHGDTQALYNNFFGLYVNSNGSVLPGLVTRRRKEFELFHNHVWQFGY